ncbi:MAG TPA: hypothetical protein VMV32_00275 [Ignavibacteriaceae bacterium]|nr:hypothetical protein [Ignavibacteriaceae bacterium]
MTGIVTGFEIGKNRNGSKDVVLLQVRLRDAKDIQTIELMTPAGDDSIPVNGSKVAILQVSSSYKIAIAQNDNITPIMGAGEKMIYSQAGDVIKAFTKWLDSGIIELNGNNDFAVQFNALKTGFDLLVTNFNAHVHTETGGTTSAPTIPSTADIDASKVSEVKII